MSYIVIIPARFESSRLPGKPLLDIAGKPMIQHVVERAKLSEASAVYVATDNEQIAQVCESFGAQVCMTSAQHVSGTDRLEEAITDLGLSDDEIIVNVQGDEPLIPPAVINQVATNMQRQHSAGMCTLFEPINNFAEVENPNVVKLTADINHYALTFSRAQMPFLREGEQAITANLYKRHVGIYAYRAKVLHQFVNWPVAALENAEKLEQLRALYNGVKIHVAQACEDIPVGVDTPEDLALIRNLLKHPTR